MAFNTKYIWTLVFFGTGLLFAIFSLLLILRVNLIRETVEVHVANINTLSRLEAEVFLNMNTVEKDPDAVITKKINKLIAFPDIPANAVDFSSLEAVVQDHELPLKKERLIRELILIKKSCQYGIGESRQQLRMNSEKLLSYWNYTHGLLIFASILLLILPITLYRANRQKHPALS